MFLEGYHPPCFKYLPVKILLLIPSFTSSIFTHTHTHTHTHSPFLLRTPRHWLHPSMGHCKDINKHRNNSAQLCSVRMCCQGALRAGNNGEKFIDGRNFPSFIGKETSTVCICNSLKLRSNTLRDSLGLVTMHRVKPGNDFHCHSHWYSFKMSHWEFLEQRFCGICCKII
jgi:hypothetical protein